jgi:two-component system, OmpR family, response regulator TctD
MRILLVEDNRQLSEWLARTLRRDHYAVECAYDGEDANYRLSAERYDLVILDLSLPRMEGEEVLRRLRKRDDNTPVLILTARNSLEGRIGGLDGGADDYVGKPFEVAELEARIRVLLRRSANHRNPILTCGNLSFDSNTRFFTIEDRPFALTPREHAVLQALMMTPGKTVSKQRLAETLYTLDDNVSPDAIEIYVHRLRKKMEGCEASVVTLRGLGYLLRNLSA